MIVTFKHYDKKGALRLALFETDKQVFLAKCKVTRNGYLANFVVNPDYRGEGYAKRMMNAAINNGRFPVSSLKVNPSEGSPLTFRQTSDFYAKHGFRPNLDGPMRYRAPSLGELDRAGYWVA